MIIHSALKNYAITFEKDYSFVDDLLAMENSFFVIDKNLYNFYENLFSNIQKERLLIVEANEENKVIETALTICSSMIKLEAKRNANLISFGGGIIQDITGFAANILYRGINWYFVPTTLLAACDSCIGGKTSLNYQSYKNLLGTFFPPDKIYINTSFFKTLTQMDYMSGLGEVVKFNIMSGLSGIEKLENNIDNLLQKDETVIINFVKTALEYKKNFIEEDEFDKGARVMLNFAHTFGHAYEKTSGYGIPHGTAVALGMLTASFISVLRGKMKPETEERIRAIISRITGMPVKKDWFERDSIINAIKKDKKQTGNQLSAILMNDAFELEIIKNLETEEVESAISRLIISLNIENS